jgi:hypothetical protein
MDLAGAGQPDLVLLDSPMPCLYEHDGEEGWQVALARLLIYRAVIALLSFHMGYKNETPQI